MLRILNSMSLACALFAVGCGDAETKKAPKAEPEKAEAKAADTKKATDAKADAPAAALDATVVAEVLGGYEGIRAKLAADDGAIAEDAKALAAAASTAASNAGDLGPKLEAIGVASTGLAETPADDIDAVRKQYGEVSKALVDLLTTDPALQQGKFLFECPMAKGYQKWVQNEEKMANPYMGTKMLECGSKSDWSV